MVKQTVAALRHESDMRQISGVMLALGMCAIFQPLTGVTSAISPDGGTPTTGIPFSSLFGGFCIFTIGAVSLFIGFNQLVVGWGNKYLTFCSLLLVQTAYIPYITGMTNVGKMTRTGAAFIPAAYNPSEADVRFVGGCGICAIMAYGFGFIGSLAFTHFALYTYQKMKYNDRNASYYRGRGAFYSFVLFFAGASQFALGTFVLVKFGNGAGVLENGPVRVAQYTVYFPVISMVVGLVQICCGIWGFARMALKVGVYGAKDHSFQTVMYFAWIAQVTLQVLVQVGYAPGPTFSGAAPTVTAFTVGLNLMPAYLDYKARNAPDMIGDDYYDGAESTGDFKKEESGDVEHALEEAVVE